MTVNREGAAGATTPGRKRKILFFAEAVTLSHVARPAFLADALDPTRYDVVMVRDSRYDALLGKPAWPVVEVASSVDPSNLLATLTGNRPLFELETLEHYVREDLALIETHAPDLIVGDMRQSLSVSARLASVPYANVINAQWSPYARVPFELPEAPGEPLLGRPLANFVFQFTAPLGFAGYTIPANRLRLKFGLPPLGPDIKRVFCDGDFVLYPDVPEIVPTSSLPPTHRYIGPIMWTPDVAPPAWWDDLPDGRPVVYVNLGSSGRNELLGAILAACAGLEVTVVAATVGGPPPASIPANAYLAPYLPGIEACKRARLVVCNGGNLATQQALAGGAPVVGVVTNMDQLVFMKAVSDVGAGAAVRERDADEASLRRLIWRVLHHEPYFVGARRAATALNARSAAAEFRAFVDAATALPAASGASRG